MHASFCLCLPAAKFTRQESRGFLNEKGFRPDGKFNFDSVPTHCGGDRQAELCAMELMQEYNRATLKRISGAEKKPRSDERAFAWVV
jgi:hypothetical protein